MQTLKGLRDKLRRPMAGGAVRQNPDNERSAVNPMYVVERLNDCFGEDGWTADYIVKEAPVNGKMIVVECQLRCWLPWIEPRPERADIIRRAFGGNNNEDRGDAYKGACTDALTKAASHLGIAHQVYKGLYDLQPQPVIEQEKPKQDGRKINQAQVQNFSKALRESGKSEGDLEEFLHLHSIKSIADMLKIDYEAAMDWARRKSEAA